MKKIRDVGNITLHVDLTTNLVSFSNPLGQDVSILEGTQKTKVETKEDLLEALRIFMVYIERHIVD